ncbi:MAG: hypothetical protein JKY45_00265 [Emcibacter sp.]|nr:hypothetical protein [Emcibacter sp.]
MTFAKLTIGQLPYWPARMSREQAAAYLGVSPGHFDKYNKPHFGQIREGGRVLYRLTDLERFVSDSYNVPIKDVALLEL